MSNEQKMFEEAEDKRIEDAKKRIIWNCRFHPTDSWHEMGCPHQEWSKEQLQEAVIALKISQVLAFDAYKELAEHRKALREEV